MSSPTSQLRLGEKLAYGAGTFATTCTVALTGYVLFYYTDVFGISASAAGTLMLVVRIWDAIWDLFVGRWVDTTRTPQGQARPFLRWAGGVLLLSYLLTFFVPDLAPGLKLVYACVTFTLMQMAFSLVTIPYNALLAALTPDHEERTRVAGVQAFSMFLVVLLVGAGTMPLVMAAGQGDMKAGFFRVGAAYGVLAALLSWNCYRATRERVQLPPVGTRAEYASGLQVVSRQRTWRAMALVSICNSVGIGMSLSAGAYYFRYVVGQPGMVGPFMGLGGLGLLIGVLLSDRLTRRFCKRQVCMVMLGLSALLMAGLFVVPPTALPVVLGLNLLANLCLGACAPIHGSMAADTIDQIEHATGKRLVGATTSTLAFANKVGAGLGGGLPGLILGAAGYLAGAETQTPSAQLGILLNLSLIPAAFFLAAALLTGVVYPLNRERLQRQQNELADRRKLMPAPLGT
jgi:GPH family glycoside/pentoside/hexuronide:cation symporter